MKLSASIFCAICFLTACNSASDKEAVALKAKQATIDSMKVVIAKQAVIDSMNAVSAQREAEVQAQNEEKSSQIAANNSVAPVAAKKKGWNHTAKGAVVGAGTGAIAGAIINKHHAKGALIGSLIGGGAGAGTGAIVDAAKKKKNKGN